MFLTVKIHHHALEKPFKSKKCLLDRTSSSSHPFGLQSMGSEGRRRECVPVCVVGGEENFRRLCLAWGGTRRRGGLGRGLPSFLSPIIKDCCNGWLGAPPPTQPRVRRRALSLALSCDFQFPSTPTTGKEGTFREWYDRGNIRKTTLFCWVCCCCFGLRGGFGGPAASGGGFPKVCGGCHGRRGRILA